MNAVARSFAARALSFVPTALATLLTSRLIIDHYGIAAFDAFALILSLINLIPLNNLGVGAAITSAYAQSGPGDEHAERTVLTASRVLALSGLGTAVVSMLLAGLRLWEPLLGKASGQNLWVGLALVAYALTFLPGLGQSMLLGVHRNHVTIFVQTLFNPLIALLAGAVVLADVSGSVLVLLPCLALLVVNIGTAVLAGRATELSWSRLLRRLPSPRRFPGASIRAMSGPVLLVTLSTPIALQSDRIVLSHVSTERAVAQYTIALQIFSPALVLIAASAQPLWPIWTQARAAGRRGPGVGRVTGLFCLGGLAVGAVLALLAGPVASLVAGDHVRIPHLLAFAGALGVLTAAASQPVAMSLMDPGGVRVVMWSVLIALPLNVGLSIVLARHYGAAGPLLASCIIGLGVQALPALGYSRRRQRGEHHARVAEAEAQQAEEWLRGMSPADAAPGPVSDTPMTVADMVAADVPGRPARPRPSPRPRPAPARDGRAVPASRPSSTGGSGPRHAAPETTHPDTPAPALEPWAPFRRPSEGRRASRQDHPPVAPSARRPQESEPTP